MTKMITDTTAGLPEEVVRRHNIPLMPQVILFGSEWYKRHSIYGRTV